MSKEKKIIIDEDWKSQVQAEKEAAQKEQSAGAPPEPDSTAPPDDFPMPPASLEMLLSTLVTEAMIAMGQMPYPGTNETVVRRNQAKYLIDTIDVIRDKTKGNVTAEETEMMENVLHQLRMAFVRLGEVGPN
jgi:Domain of unknown function (DUF1844)